METFIQKIKRVISEIVFDAHRKSEIRDRLAGFMHAHPAVRAADAVRLIPQSQRSLLSFKLKFMPIFATFLLVALLGGGTSFAAQGALPGDALYPVKVGINEEVKASLTFGTQAKAEWEAERLVRRLEEKAALDARPDEPSPKAAAQLEELFLKHAEKIEARLVELEQSGKTDAAAEVAVQVEASLAAYKGKQEVAVALSATAKPAFEEKVSAALDKIIDARAEFEAKTIAGKSAPEVKAAAEGKIKAAENVITSASRYVEKWEAKSESGASASIDAEAKINAAKEISAEAKAKLDAGEYAEAFKLAQDALKVSHEAKFEVRQEVFVKKQTKADPMPMVEPSPGWGEIPENPPFTADPCPDKAIEILKGGPIEPCPDNRTKPAPPTKDKPEPPITDKPIPPPDKDKPKPPKPIPLPPPERRICPEVWVEDRMPIVIEPGEKLPGRRGHLIIGGAQYDLNGFSASELSWMQENCKFEERIVY